MAADPSITTRDLSATWVMVRTAHLPLMSMVSLAFPTEQDPE